MEYLEHESYLDPELIHAYRATRYHVLGAAPFEFCVDTHSPSLEALMRSAGVRAAAFVTAWNPRGMSLPPMLNQARQDELRAELAEAGLRTVEGFGAHPQDPSQGEDSLLVLGLDRVDACALGVRHEQNAVVWSGEDAVPRLVLLG